MNDIISVVDDFLDQWDPSTSTLMEEMYGPREKETTLKNKLIWTQMCSHTEDTHTMSLQPLAK